MNNGWNSKILIKLVESFFKHQNRDKQETRRKEKLFLEKVLSVSFFVIFVVSLSIWHISPSQTL